MENKNGQGIFYGVIGVATLVVAIIGATFAYFSATANTQYDQNITGQTLDVGGNNLSLVVKKVELSGAHSISPNLVPANMGTTYSDYATAVTNACEDDSDAYTGCHLYEVTATSASAINGATITFHDMEASAATYSNWKYAIWKDNQTPTDGDLITSPANTFGATGAGTSQVVLNNKTLAQGTTKYYLLVWLQNETEKSQNNDGTTGATNETGTYSGKVDLQVTGGGHVSATFTAA